MSNSSTKQQRIVRQVKDTLSSDSSEDFVQVGLSNGQSFGDKKSYDK
jgi:hypothetical protein